MKDVSLLSDKFNKVEFLDFQQWESWIKNNSPKYCNLAIKFKCYKTLCKTRKKHVNCLYCWGQVFKANNCV